MSKIVEQALLELQMNVRSLLGDIVLKDTIKLEEYSICVKPDQIVDTLLQLKESGSTRFISFIDLCAVDYLGEIPRFEIVYHLLSPSNNNRIRIKTQIEEDQSISSVAKIFAGATWFEREAFDMYGIVFEGLSDLRRLLTDYDFTGYPLRKDFPLTGFVEARYDEIAKKVIYEPVTLQQEFRDFDFDSPWDSVSLERKD